MDFTFSNSVISIVGLFLVVIVLGALLAFVLRERLWVMRLLVSAYVGLALVLVMPQEFFFSGLADFFFFVLFALGIFFWAPGRLFDAEGEWLDDRFPWRLAVFYMIFLTFLCALWLSFAPKQTALNVFSNDVYTVFATQPWFFIWAALPLVYAAVVRR